MIQVGGDFCGWAGADAYGAAIADAGEPYGRQWPPIGEDGDARRIADRRAARRMRSKGEEIDTNMD